MAQLDRTHNDMRATIQKALDERGDNYVIAAMIEGSIGYHTYNHAKRLVDEFKSGEEVCYCERASLYDNDLLSMMDDDVRLMQRIEEYSPDKVKVLVQFAEKTSQMSNESQESISLLYPTL